MLPFLHALKPNLVDNTVILPDSSNYLPTNDPAPSVAPAPPASPLPPTDHPIITVAASDFIKDTTPADPLINVVASALAQDANPPAVTNDQQLAIASVQQCVQSIEVVQSQQEEKHERMQQELRLAKETISGLELKIGSHERVDQSQEEQHKRMQEELRLAKETIAGLELKIGSYERTMSTMTNDLSSVKVKIFCVKS